ncbi:MULTISPECIES: hypothetical protein [Micrococcaceae]|uniref:Uncharacterized protein n=1 Tax=Pseudoglutamicibacter albus DNF00011 TaxID=1401063 RepID=A0A095ZN36_9MICC|nr:MULTISPECIES: hypothetical protein [Micrococcaceae]KGF19997.1 hypothetical protein HMPREF2128_06775 [Pseudoglutamicibacter albus DNF00011]MCG7303920.1 hypothetical protein [Pseudoglutamicibacter albus]OFT23902.1 hypothetical protein HMPREF3175_02900 [Arthrobacter sp. HMSC08H08]OFT41031.1 hypothetical protein HMPREF3160_08675 [Arthrobacter sp. HMSC06H05]
MNEKSTPPEPHTTPSQVHEQTISSHVAELVDENRKKRRNVYIGVAGFLIGFVPTVLGMHLPWFIDPGETLLLVPMAPFILGIIGLQTALFTPRKHLGWGIFAGTVIAFMASIAFWSYLIGIKY